MNAFEAGKHAVSALASAQHTERANEATTRLQAINTMLHDVLAWPLESTRCEEHVEGDYLDYVLGAPEARVVVEAKRSEAIFVPPAGVASGIVDLSTFRGHSKHNSESIDQVLGYCQKAGIAIAVLTNGAQYLAFLGSRADGKKPREGKAVYYANLSDIADDFHTFWDYFSMHGILSGTLSRRLARGNTLPQAPMPLSSRIHQYPGYRIGSEMETDLSILGNLFVQDIAREEDLTDDFLRHCYCTSGALSQYAVVSKEILKTRYQALRETVRTETARDRSGTSRKLTDDILASAISKRPIILLGDVGVGKSIFLKNLFRIEADELLENTTVFYVDFLKHSGLVEDVPEHVVQTIKAGLERDRNIDIEEASFIRSVYNRELNAFLRGIWGELEETDPAEYSRRRVEMLGQKTGDVMEHARRSLEHIQASSGINFVIVLDNVDQHQPSFQEQIFKAGHALAETWPCAVFMSLRPDTFHESRRSGVLAAYQPRVFTVSPPRSDLVITKRLQYARQDLEEAGRLNVFPQGLTLNSESLLVYIDVLIDAFEHNRQLIELIDNLSSGNTRRALDFVSTFVGSGYVQTSRILDSHREGRSYIIPLHEFERAILYGDYQYYDPNTSPVINLFDVVHGDGKEHFLLALLIEQARQEGGGSSGGFAELGAVTSPLQALGYRPEQLEYHLERAVKGRLLESTESRSQGQIVRVTPAGAYLTQKMAHRFTYLDAVVVDTPIIDPGARAQIKNVSDIADRFDRASLFADYLDSVWPFSGESLPFSWPQVRVELDSSLKVAREGSARAAKRRRKGGF